VLRSAVIGAAWFVAALAVMLTAWSSRGAWPEIMLSGFSPMTIDMSLAPIGAGIGLVALEWYRQSSHIALVPLWASASLCLLALLLDVSTPYAAGMAYIPFVLCGVWFVRPHIAFAFATIATALTAFAFFAKAPADIDLRMILVDRFLPIGALWLVATLVYAHQQTNWMRKRNEYKLNTVINHAVDGLISIDNEGVIEHFNPACERIFGYGLEEVLGRKIEMLMSEPPPANSGGLLHYFSASQEQTTGMVKCEVHAKRKDGSVFPMELALSSFQLKDGRYFPEILRDVSVRKQVEEKKALLAAIVASSDDAIISKTLEGVITSWNVGAERLLGYSAEETIGRHINLIIPPERLDEERDILERLDRGEEIHHFETARLNKNGQHINVSLTTSRVQGATGRVIGISTIIRDITAQKKIEAELLGYTLALEQSNSELDEFAHIASHDLKEPLRGMFNNATFLHEDYQDKLDSRGVIRLKRLCYLSRRMEILVNDLLYFSRLGRQELAIQPTELNAAIDDIALMMETTLKEENAIITIAGPLPEIVCDKIRVTEVFRNLITNAVKYNNKEKKIIEIGCLSGKQASDRIEKQVFYVKDNGFGINEEFHEEIFRIFKRLNEEDDEKKGTGVGLTFVRKIIERHGGRIWLESTPGEGTTFYFTLTPSVTDVAA
jgi:PAS domain S-box-containing protein